MLDFRDTYGIPVLTYILTYPTRYAFKGERYHKLRVKFWGKDCTGTVFKISIRKKVSEIRGPLRSVSEPLGDADQIDVRRCTG